MTKIRLLGACWVLLLAPCAVAQTVLSPAPTVMSPLTTSPTTPTLKPTYWKQRLFFIPYQLNSNRQQRSPIAKVELLYARRNANDWKVLQQAEPNVRGFSYHAPEDGEYWFALRHLDRRGQPWPNAEVRPQMRIVIDTTQPVLTLTATIGLTGEAIIRYEAQDANLNTQSLSIEVRGQDLSKQGQTKTNTGWTPLQLGPADITYPNQLVGRVRWRLPTDMKTVEVRAAITDQAGLRTQVTTTSSAPINSTQGPALSSPLEKAVAPAPPSSARPLLARSPFAAPPLAVSPTAPTLQPRTTQLPARNWPANNRLPAARPTTNSTARSTPRHTPSSSLQTPPQTNPYSVTGMSRPNRTPTALAGQSQTLSITPLGIDNAPPLTNANQRPTQTNPAQANQWLATSSAANPTAIPSNDPTNHLADRVVNSRTFDIDYDLQSVGPWGVSKVELWGTHDNGRTWRSFATDVDNRSPIRVTVAAAGTFGFRILVDGANSVGSAPPQPGDAPELTVTVDLQPPTAKLLSAALGAGNLAGHLQVEWTASDNNLEPRPIALFYSSYPNGPWSTIASGLENTGSYTWRIERHIPARFYLRLEARDIAGNLATYQNPAPIELARPQPKGRLRGVRSISAGVRP